MQESARLFHAFVDTERIVHVRVVDKALPAGCRAWFLKINAHDQQQRIVQFIGQCLEPAGIIDARDRVVNRTGANNDEQAGITPVEDIAQGFAAVYDGLCRLPRKRNARQNFFGRRHRLKIADVDIFDGVLVVGGIVGRGHFLDRGN